MPTVDKQSQSKTEETPQKFVYVPMTQYQSFGSNHMINMHSLMQNIWKGKWFIFGFTISGMLVAIFFSLFIFKASYKSEAVLIPTIQESHITNLNLLVSNLPLDTPGITVAGTDLITAFLNSRTLHERLIEKNFISLELSFEDIKKQYNVSKSAANLIKISWIDEDPYKAKSMLEYIIRELQFFLENDYSSNAKFERKFIENQLSKIIEELSFWEKKQPDSIHNDNDIRRERIANLALYNEMRRQYEIAKIKEEKEIVRFKVLDNPFLPNKRYGYQLKVFYTLSLMSSFILASLFVLVFNGIKKISRNMKEKNS
jgi:uncharacterized protein involved in exopolysaccharide biosynthesis